MKGLLMRDLNITWHVGRALLLYAAVFTLFPVFWQQYTFFTFYPGLLISLLPLSVFSADERSHWNLYADTLPCSRAQQVSVKYLLNLLCTGAVIVFVTLCQLARQIIFGSVSLGDLLFAPLVMLTISLLSNAICFPLAFRFGMEKGRLMYYCLIGVLAVFCGLMSSDFGSVILTAFLSTPLTPGILFSLVVLAALGLFALSWRVSIAIYRNQELY